MKPLSTVFKPKPDLSGLSEPGATNETGATGSTDADSLIYLQIFTRSAISF